MIFLKITAANGIATLVPDNYVLQVVTAADTRDAGSAYRAPNVVRGKITSVKYYDGANATAGAIVAVASISAYVTGGIKYEYGMITPDGAFVTLMSN